MIWRVFTLLICCFAVQSSTAGSLSWVSQERWVSVKHVIDGDTFTTRRGEKVRLLGINTPETRHDTSPAQPLGNEAKTLLKRLIDGQQVRLGFDKEKKDKYGRTLAHVYLRDGLWVNADMVRQGLAHVYTFVPNTYAAEKLQRIEQEAIQHKRNMWSHPRWKVLEVDALDKSLLGQFRLVQASVSKVSRKRFRFQLGKLEVTIPRKYREGFKPDDFPHVGDKVLVRGRLRMSNKNKWFLSIHDKSDMAHIK